MQCGLGRGSEHMSLQLVLLYFKSKLKFFVCFFCQMLIYFANLDFLK